MGVRNWIPPLGKKRPSYPDSGVGMGGRRLGPQRPRRGRICVLTNHGLSQLGAAARPLHEQSKDDGARILKSSRLIGGIQVIEKSRVN